MPSTPPTAVFHPEQRMAQLLALQRRLHVLAAQLRPLPPQPHRRAFDVQATLDGGLPPARPHPTAH